MGVKHDETKMGEEEIILCNITARNVDEFSNKVVVVKSNHLTYKVLNFSVVEIRDEIIYGDIRKRRLYNRKKFLLEIDIVRITG